MILQEADQTGAERIVIDKDVVCEDFFILSTGMAGEILQKFMNYHVKVAVCGGSKNAGKVAVLEEGMKYQQIGIPPHMVGDLDKSSFSNIEQQSLQKALLLPQEKRVMTTQNKGSNGNR